jgi:hypothetical protein
VTSLVCEMACENFAHLQPVDGRALGILIGLDVCPDDRFLGLPSAQLLEFGQRNVAQPTGEAATKGVCADSRARLNADRVGDLAPELARLIARHWLAVLLGIGEDPDVPRLVSDRLAASQHFNRLGVQRVLVLIPDLVRVCSPLDRSCVEIDLAPPQLTYARRPVPGVPQQRAARRAHESAPDYPMYMMPFGIVLHAAGRIEEARAMKARAFAGGLPSLYRGMLHAMFGERDDAIAALERGYEERGDWMYTLPVQAYFRELREDPRFLAIVEKVRRAGPP